MGISNKIGKYHHSALCRGYVGVRQDGWREEYVGRFGNGYIIHRANLRQSLGNRHSNNYHVIEYYIYE